MWIVFVIVAVVLVLAAAWAIRGDTWKRIDDGGDVNDKDAE